MKFDFHHFVHLVGAGDLSDIKKALAYQLSFLEKIMSKFTEYAAKQKAWNETQEAANKANAESAAGLSGDLAELNRKITALQNSPGAWTPEDQALLDELAVQGEDLAVKNAANVAALKALDEQTAPAVPAEPV